MSKPRLIKQSESTKRMQHDDINSLLEYHHKDCYGWALHCCKGDRELSIDVLQASYLKALEKYSTFAGKSAFKTWVFKIIRNTALDEMRKAKREKIFMLGQVNSRVDILDTGFENQLEMKLSAAFFTEALEQLSVNQQRIMHLVFYHDMSLTQAAETLNVSNGTVRKQYDRAKKYLSIWFQQKGIEKNNISNGPI